MILSLYAFASCADRSADVRKYPNLSCAMKIMTKSRDKYAALVRDLNIFLQTIEERS